MSLTSTRFRGILLVGAGVVLIPWIGALLGSAGAGAGGPLVVFWAGLDGLEMVELLGAGMAVLGVAWCRPWLAPLCLGAATLLAADALVDVSTAASYREVVVASVMAVFAELPLAGVCLSLLAPSAASTGAATPTGPTPPAAPARPTVDAPDHRVLAAA